jgi:diguanylate cyclase (GGDEF)-like protein
MEKLHVLIVEDDRDTAVFFNTVLNLAGCKCEIACSSKDAMDHLAGNQPDLILLDIHMGYEKDGEALLYQIRTNQRLDKTRLIGVTTYPFKGKTLAELDNMVAPKLVDTDQLRNLVERIGSHRENQEQLYFRDPLTGLFNQEYFLTQLEHSIERAKRRPDYYFSALAFSLDPQEKTKQQLTTDEVNIVLVATASRLTRYIRPTDTIARMYGETFASLHEDIKKPLDAEVIAKRILEKLSVPYAIREEPVPLKFSIGAVANGRLYQQALDILNDAEKAMEGVQNSGGNDFAIGDHT